MKLPKPSLEVCTKCNSPIKDLIFHRVFLKGAAYHRDCILKQLEDVSKLGPIITAYMRGLCHGSQNIEEALKLKSNQ